MQGEKVGVREREETSDIRVGTKGEIWPFEPGRCKIFKIYSEDLEIAAKIAGWKGCRYHATYHYPDGRIIRDVLIPARLYKRAAALLGLPPPAKNPNRVRAGKKAGAAAVAGGQLKSARAEAPKPLIGADAT